MFSESDLHNPSLDAQVAAAVAYQNIRDHGLMRRPPYHLHHHHDVANPPFYQFEDVPLPCSAGVYDHCGIVEPATAAAAAYLYNPTSMVYDYGSSCPDCCDRELALSDAAKSSGDDATCPGRRPTRKRSLSQAELERRRSLANHQERRRMHRLNSALDRLRSAIPLRLQSGGGGASNSSSPSSRRLSKIKTLKMAISYIGELQTVLGVAAAGSGRCWN
ncbi:pancreas transcription factor 1 subunit alpha isoform X1 [Ixodes scapularis]